MKKKQKPPIVAQRDYLMAVSRLSYSLALEGGAKDKRGKIAAPDNREVIVDAVLLSIIGGATPFSRLDDWNDRYHEQLKLMGVYDGAGHCTV